MTELRPFRALRYDPERCELGRVLVPPYDVVAPHEREAYYERDPHNAIRLELTRRVEDEHSADYAEVAETLAAWQQSGVLRRDKEAAFYALRQEFTRPDAGEAKSARDGFFALIRLEDYESRTVRPHERTMRGPVEDRLKVLRAAEANLSPVFFLYEDAEQELDKVLAEALDGEEGVAGTDASGIHNRLVPIAAPAAQERIAEFLRGRPVVIADGHHRYETALAFRDERPELSGAHYLLGYFANAYAGGTSLLPIHRVLRGSPQPGSAWRRRLQGWTATSVPFPDVRNLSGWLDRNLAPRAGAHAFVADDATGEAWVFERPRAAKDELTIRVIHDEVLSGAFGIDARQVREGAVAFPKSAAEAARMVRAGEGWLSLYLNPLTAREVFAVTGAGEVLPQKSTFFFPKLPSGLLFRLLDEGGD